MINKKPINGIRCACLRLNDTQWIDCNCFEKAHFMCRKDLNAKKEENFVEKSSNDTETYYFFTRYDDNEDELNSNEIEDDNIDPMKINEKKASPNLVNLIFTSGNSVPLTQQEVNMTLFNETKINEPIALSLNSGDRIDMPLQSELATSELSSSSEEQIAVENMENDLMKLAQYLTSQEFNQLYKKIIIKNNNGIFDLQDNDTYLFQENDINDIDENHTIGHNLKFLKEDSRNSAENVNQTNFSLTQADNSLINNLLIQTLKETNKLDSIASSNIRSIANRHELNLLKMKVLKDSNAFKTIACPNSFGYYFVNDTSCQQYKKCENINEYYAFISLFKCIDDYIFDLSQLKCVSKTLISCVDQKENFKSL